ncbi:MAG: bifunctional phosphoribosylaminoimidazolecarboxamide formyltransferase/IMP cyclohydrolase [Myxococcales bacterium]|nr:MAG: bifunctional phosphoribosylaminoimidazolecarboxamide formyltransferase/IMP cyclohydrolase [Myxococcales bacterium]
MADVKRALVSVSDKTGIVEFAQDLSKLGVEILSTGGTAKALKEAGVSVIEVSQYTESPEVMDGRVKTLHPRVHGAILMRDTDADRKELASLGGKAIDLVVVNLYPFQNTVQRGAAHAEIVENIDIGGPSMLRSAAKNYARVVVVVDPADYSSISAEIKQKGQLSDEKREALAAKAFAHTAAYDGHIASYFASRQSDSAQGFPERLELSFQKGYDLRYGENPHQKAAFYAESSAPAGSLARAKSVGAGGKELSFNNFVDVEAALDAVREFERPAAVVVKHTNPCGVAEAETLEQAYRASREADALSAFGGIVALNRRVDAKTAAMLTETFLECVVAPDFDEAALELLHKKANLRLLATGSWLGSDHEALQYKRIGGGLVVQERDRSGIAEALQGKCATKRQATDSEKQALDFAWRVCKHVKSNAIVLAKAEPILRTVGVGAGQMSRVISVELAADKAGHEAKGSVLASDAFFPFPDGVEKAAAAGISAIVQPGGSKKDNDVIAAADAAGIAMLMTGVRHFRH